MPEYLNQRCCMCPNVQRDVFICPGIANTPHPEDSLCRFVKTYQDERGWRYFVHSGIGGEEFKTFYLKPGKSGGGHAYRNLPWQNSFDKAQGDMNALAKKKGWTEVLANA